MPRFREARISSVERDHVPCRALFDFDSDPRILRPLDESSSDPTWGATIVLRDNYVPEPERFFSSIEHAEGPLSLVMWTGTLARDLFEQEPINWTGRGAQALLDWCSRMNEPLKASGVRVLFEPHARHILSDAQGTCTFFVHLHERFGADAPFSIAYAPLNLFEPEMVADLDDHLMRFSRLLAEHVELLIVSDRFWFEEESPSQWNDEPRSAPSELANRVERVACEYLDPGVPILVRESKAIDDPQD